MNDPGPVIHSISETLCVLDNKWVGQNARFVADPFLRKHRNRWYLFFEVMWDDMHKEIGVATSENLTQWDIVGFVLDKAPCSFPYVFLHENEWWMFPYQDNVPDLLVYRTIEEDFPLCWREWARLRLDRFANDRIVTSFENQLIVLFGSRINRWFGTCLRWGLLSNDKTTFKLREYVKIRSVIEWARNRVFSSPVPTYRLAGDKLCVPKKEYVPLQAYGKRREYGSQFGLFELSSYNKMPNLEPRQYLEGNFFVPHWDFTHHLSNQWMDDQLVLVADGRSANSNWEIGIFLSDAY